LKKKLLVKRSHVERLYQLKGVELSYPSDFQGYSPEMVMDKLRNKNLEISAINIDLFSKPKWQKGSITSLDNSVRRDAVELVKDGIDLARKLGVKNINLWLGQDGHDYLFQITERSGGCL